MSGRYLRPEEIPPVYRYGFAVTVPLIQTPIYLPYLRRRLRMAGGRIIAQDEQTSVVFGMPGAAISAGLADVTMPLGAISTRLRELATS